MKYFYLKLAFILQKITRTCVLMPLVNKMCEVLIRKIREFFAKKLSDGFVTTFDKNIKIYVSLSDHIESQIFWQGFQAFDKGEYELFKSILKADYVFFDVGANIGVFTLMAATRIKNGLVYAFEPLRFHIEKLSFNVKINGFTNVIICAVGLSNSDGLRSIYVPEIKLNTLINTGQASFFPFSERMKKEQIMTTTIDNFCLKNNIRRLDIIKIDVEGAEMEVLEGGINSVKVFRPFILMEVDKNHLARAGRRIDDLIYFLRNINYAFFIIQQNGLLTKATNLLDSQNIFCCPAEKISYYQKYIKKEA